MNIKKGEKIKYHKHRIYKFKELKEKYNINQSAKNILNHDDFLIRAKNAKRKVLRTKKKTERINKKDKKFYNKKIKKAYKKRKRRNSEINRTYIKMRAFQASIRVAATSSINNSLHEGAEAEAPRHIRRTVRITKRVLKTTSGKLIHAKRKFKYRNPEKYAQKNLWKRQWYRKARENFIKNGFKVPEVTDVKNNIKKVLKNIFKFPKVHLLSFMSMILIPLVVIIIGINILISVIAGLFASSNFTSPLDVMTELELYYQKKEANLILEMKENSSTGIVYKTKVGHDPNELIALMTAKFGELKPTKTIRSKGKKETVSNIKMYHEFLDSVFNVHYQISDGEYYEESSKVVEALKLTDSYKLSDDMKLAGVIPPQSMTWIYDKENKQWKYQGNGVTVNKTFSKDVLTPLNIKNGSVNFTYNSATMEWEHFEKVKDTVINKEKITVKSFKSTNFKEVCKNFLTESEFSQYELLTNSELKIYPLAPPFKGTWKDKIKKEYGYFVNGSSLEENHNLVLSPDPAAPILAMSDGVISSLSDDAISLKLKDGKTIKYKGIKKPFVRLGEEVKEGKELGYTKGTLEIAVLLKSQTLKENVKPIEAEDPIYIGFNRPKEEVNPYFMIYSNPDDIYSNYYYPKGYFAGDVMIQGSAQETFWNFFISQGYSKEAVAGMMGNIEVESGGFSTSAIEAEPSDGNAGIGLCQWTSPSRKQGLLNYAASKGKPWQDLGIQLEWLNYELNGSYKDSFPGGLEAFKNSASIYDATYDFCWSFEIPGIPHFDRRLTYAEYYYNQFKNYDILKTNAVVEFCYNQLGKPYILGAAGPDAFDCSGLVKYISEHFYGLEVPHSSVYQAEIGKLIELKDIRPGDFVFFDTYNEGLAGHAGVYVGNGDVIHASSPETGVKKTELQTFIDLGMFWNIRRYN